MQPSGQSDSGRCETETCLAKSWLRTLKTAQNGKQTRACKDHGAKYGPGVLVNVETDQADRELPLLTDQGPVDNFRRGGVYDGAHPRQERLYRCLRLALAVWIALAFQNEEV